MSDDKKLKVVLCWHMHQPDYRGPEHGTSPWPTSMRSRITSTWRVILNRFRMPERWSILPRCCLNSWKICVAIQTGWTKAPYPDPLLAAVCRDRESPSGSCFPAGEPGKSCQRANEKHLVKRFRTFHQLIDITKLVDEHDESVMYLNDQFLADLLVWYHLAWMGNTHAPTTSDPYAGKEADPVSMRMIGAHWFRR